MFINNNKSDDNNYIYKLKFSHYYVSIYKRNDYQDYKREKYFEKTLITY